MIFMFLHVVVSMLLHVDIPSKVPHEPTNIAMSINPLYISSLSTTPLHDKMLHTSEEELDTASLYEVFEDFSIYWSNPQEENALSCLTGSSTCEIQRDEAIRVRNLRQGLPVFTDEDIGRPSTSRNIGRDTNNPGNLVNGLGQGAIGIYLSKNGRYYTVFANVED